MGLTDGEGLERFWSAIRHLIASLQCSTSFSRLQILSQIAIEHGEKVQRTLARRFLKLFEAALQKITDNGAKLAMADVTELKIQSARRKEFYSAKPEGSTRVIEDEIFETIYIRQTLVEYLQELLVPGRDAMPHIGRSRKLMEIVTHNPSGRIGLDCTPDTLTERLSELFRSTNPPQTIKDWVTIDGEPTVLYLRYQKRHHLRALIKIKHEIWKILVRRRCEILQLHGSSSLRGILLHFLVY